MFVLTEVLAKRRQHSRYRPSDQIREPSTETPTTTPGAPTSAWLTLDTELRNALPQPDGHLDNERGQQLNAHAYLAAYLYPLHKVPANFSGTAVAINSPRLRFFAGRVSRVILIV